ncbi:MAG: DUF63 family protein [Methanobacteriaceae archaeon]|jgi:uncharacterized membrane protein|nr:DUF63 family protein [Methanobacteriaceae archaeon]
MLFNDFLKEYFFSGYTIFNTLIYGIILIIFLELIYRLFKKININPKNLIYSLIPLILFGSTIRALVDNNILQYNYFLITPGIYFIVGFIGIIILLIGYILKNTIDYRKSIFLLGSLISIFPLLLINEINLEAILLILLIWLVISSLFLILGKYFKIFKSKINLSIISAHILDATTTFVGVDFYNYTEQHVLPSGIYNIFQTAITMYPLKLIVIISCIYLVDKYIEDETLNGLLKLVMFVLGLAPGLRNLLTIAIGT